MKHTNLAGAPKLLALLCVPLLLALPTLDTLAQLRPQTQLTPLRRLPVTEPGTNAFGSFNRDEKGHSLTNSYLLAMVSHYMYPHAYQPNTGNNFSIFRNKAKEKFELWGMRDVDIRSKGSVQYVVMSDANVIVVGFRGSDAVEHMDGYADWIETDLKARQEKVTTWGTVPFDERNWYGQLVKVYKEPGVHTGIKTAYWTVRSDINALIGSHGGRSKKLFFTGHSLGAGLAVLAALDQGYAKDRPASRRYLAQGVYTYGGPRVGNGIFKKLYDSKRSDGNVKALNTHRYVNFNDIIPMMPGDTLADDVLFVPVTHYGPGEPHDNVKYIHVGRTCNIRQNGTIARDSAEYRGIGDPFAHHSSLYAHHIFHAHVAGKSWANRMPPPPEPTPL